MTSDKNRENCEEKVFVSPTPKPLTEFQPFPTDALPEPVRSFVEAGAKSIGCDATYIALPLFAALGAAIGNTRRIRFKKEWTAPTVIWSAIIGESGTHKTPAFNLAMRPFRERQRQAFDKHAEALKADEEEMLRYTANLEKWKREAKKNNGKAGDPPVKPEPTLAKRYLVNDTTVEALAPILRANPRGVTLNRDELSGWFGSFDRYAGGKGGADAANWLSMFGAGEVTVDRKVGNQVIHVPEAFVCITGGIQPGILKKALGIQNLENGLGARFLLAYPPRKPKRWTSATVSSVIQADLLNVVDRLYELHPVEVSEGRPSALEVPLTDKAQEDWERYVNAHGEEQVHFHGDRAAALAKLEEYPGRLALIFHLVRWAADDPTLECEYSLDAESLNGGIEVANWCKAETLRIYEEILDDADEGDTGKLVAFIKSKGGQASPRDVYRWNRKKYTDSDIAEKALIGLEKAKLGFWDYDDHGGGPGRPKRTFVLFGDGPRDTITPNAQENPNSVTGDYVTDKNGDMDINALLAQTAVEDGEGQAVA